MPRLISQSPEIPGQNFELQETELSVGRLEDNSITIQHNSVSGHHAMLRQENPDDDYTVQDLGSTNGTRVNGERVTEQKLRRNDLLRIGNIQLLYDSEHEPPGRPMPKVAERMNLAECLSRGRPGSFVNASPVPKAGMSKKFTVWALIYPLLVLLAGAGLAYFFYESVWLPQQASTLGA